MWCHNFWFHKFVKAIKNFHSPIFCLDQINIIQFWVTFKENERSEFESPYFCIFEAIDFKWYRKMILCLTVWLPNAQNWIWLETDVFRLPSDYNIFCQSVLPFSRRHNKRFIALTILKLMYSGYTHWNAKSEVFEFPFNRNVQLVGYSALHRNYFRRL